MKLTLLITLTALLMTSCVSEKKIQKVLEDNPDIVINVMKKNPVKFMEALQEMAQGAKAKMAKKRDSDEKQKFEKSFDNPLVAKIRKDEAIRGDKDAPLVLIEYSDFECPFCIRGYKTVNDLMQKYGKKIKFIYKHLPLSFHANAMIAAKYFEAARLQSSEKAFELHDEIFKQQQKLRNGEPFLKAIAKKIGLDMKRLAIDLQSKEIEKRIAEDQAEAASFGMQGTPGFLINGIPVKGAYPSEHFVQIIEKLKEKGMIKL